MKVELPLGEVVDKVTILLIKEQHIKDPAKLSNVARELATLREAWAEAGHPALEGLADWRGLRDINQRLWNVEDDIRDCERDGDFGDTFVRLARSVYHLNDQRAAHKRAINIALGSRLLEEKSYRDYKDAGGKPARTAPPSRGGGHPPRGQSPRYGGAPRGRFKPAHHGRPSTSAAHDARTLLPRGSAGLLADRPHCDTRLALPRGDSRLAGASAGRAEGAPQLCPAIRGQAR